MKKLIYISILCLIFGATNAQKKGGIIINGDTETTVVELPSAKVEVTNNNDTITKITIGQKRFEFIEKPDGNTKMNMVHIPREKFRGHFSGVQLAFCSYLGPDFSSTLPDDAYFMDPNKGKSMAFSINFLQYDIGLQRRRRSLGLVTGIGWTVYNYRTDNQYTPVRDENGKTIGEPITETVEKNKITTSYFNIPLLLEAQIPSDTRRSTAFIQAGVYGGFRIGSHTKTVTQEGGKNKSRDNINLNPIQHGAMVQVGYKFLKLYATYNFSTLYANNKGPELYPYTIGLTLVNF